MADEIIQKLGFNVSDALNALQSLDKALANTSNNFSSFGTALSAWNQQATPALTTLQAMAKAAGNLSRSLGKASLPVPQAAQAAPAAATGAATTSSRLWLPPNYTANAQAAAAATAAVGNAATAAGQKASTGMGNAGKATQGARTEADKFLVTLNTLNRVVQTQFLVRAMSMVRDAISSSVTEALKFQQAIAEIRTIAPTIGRDFGSLTAEVAQISKSFNIPLPQAARGLYQSLSNQFDTIAERSDIMSAAVKLSRVGVMDFEQAVLVLTGTLNAYGMASSQAESVAAKFFTTIKLGRITGKEIADTYGQVIPMAAQLGVTIDELNAAVVAMTIGGIDASKTMTGLRGVMTGLIKPSDDMKAGLRSMGFVSPEQLVLAKGFQGGLEAISKASHGMSSEIAESFRNVRALTAELRLTSTGAQQVADAMEAMKASTPQQLDNIFKEFRGTDAEKFMSSINSMKTTLTQDVGAFLVSLLATMTRLVGGADNMASAVKGIAAALAILTAAAVAATVALVVMNSAAGPIGLLAMAITGIVAASTGVVTYLHAQTTNAIRAAATEARTVLAEEIKTLQEFNRQAREGALDTARAAQKAWESSAAELRKNYFDALDSLKIKNNELTENTRLTLSSMVASQEKVVQAYRSSANQSVQIIQQSRQRQVAAEASYADAVFKYSLRNKNSWQQTEEVMRRGATLAGQAASALAGAKTSDQVQAAIAIAQRAEAYGQEAKSIADSSGNLTLQERAQNNLLGIVRQRVNAEQRLQRIAAEQAMKSAKTAAEEQRRLDTMKKLMASILKDLNAFGKDGAKDPKALKEQQDRLQKNVDLFKKEAGAGKKAVSVEELLAFDDLQRRVTMAIEGGVSDAQIKDLYALPETFAKFRDDIEKGVGPVRVLVDLIKSEGSKDLQQELSGLSAEGTMGVASQRYSTDMGLINQDSEMQDAIREKTQLSRRAQSNASKQLLKWFENYAEKEVAGQNELLVKWTQPKLWNERENVIQDFATKAGKFKNGDIDLKSFEELKKAYDKYLEVMKPSDHSKLVLEEFIHDAEMAASAADEANTIKKGREKMDPAVQRAKAELPLLQKALDAAALKAGSLKVETTNAAGAATRANEQVDELAQTNMSNVVQQLAMAATYATQLASASARFQAPTANLDLGEMVMQTAALGGSMRYLAKGGRVGTDVIPTMLAPGEFVMKAASSRKFASQLVAMNAGSRPTFRSAGGSVTNVGDINVSVTGGSSGRQTARSIATELRRELRRGTSTL